MKYPYFRNVYLTTYAITGFFLLIIHAPSFSFSKFPEMFFLALLILSAILFRFPLPGIRAEVVLIYPFYALGLLILKTKYIFPCFLAYILSEFGIKHEKGALGYLAPAWSSVRMVPILLVAYWAYGRLGGGEFSHFSDVNWTAFSCMVIIIVILDAITMSVCLSLVEGKPFWKMRIRLIDSFDLLFAPLAIPVFLLYQLLGYKSLMTFSLPTVGMMWLVSRFFQEGAKRQEAARLLNVSNDLVRSSLDFKEVVKTISRRVKDFLDADAVDLFVTDPGGWRLEASTSDTLWLHKTPGDSFFERLKSLSIDSPVILPDQEYIGAGFPSILFIPLESERELVGCIVAAKKIPSFFFENHVEFAKVLAGQIVLVLRGAELHEKLAVALGEIQRANEFKRQFLANVSHELRGSLHAIIGYANLLLDGLKGPLSPLQEEDMQKLAGRSKHLLRLTDDLLDLAKIESGKLDLDPKPFLIQPLIQEVCVQLEPLASQKGLSIRIEAPPDLPAVSADPNRVTQVLVNLVGNAAKFTDQGGITVSVNQVDSYAAVTVSDTGVGIPHEQIGIVFEEFRQVAGDTLRSRGGTGLGLAIAKKLVELQGGTINAESTPGKGSSFTFTLPLA